MTIYIDFERRTQRHLLLQKLTKAVCLQIELWDAIAELEEFVDVDFDPLGWVQTTSTIVDAGTDLTMSDEDDYLRGSSIESNFRESSERNWKNCGKLATMPRR
jgi:hypothetical protein